jgi:isopentenyl diphosphate isomerase/L-lactate dehydrogenase-like FMN-dependent dehydrogenase
LFSDPVFRAGLTKPPEEDLPAAVDRWADLLATAPRSWPELAALRRYWRGPIVLKGILHVDDARMAAEHGMDGIVVSNHGGRQVDGAVAALDVLPEIVDAVGDRLTVLFDSGIRTGADVIKARALGAEAVMVGRPYMYGLANAGQAGVEHVLRSLLADVDLTLGLAGYRSLDELDRGVLR